MKYVIIGILFLCGLGIGVIFGRRIPYLIMNKSNKYDTSEDKNDWFLFGGMIYGNVQT